MLALAATQGGDFRQVLSLKTIDAPTTIGPNELLVKVAWSDLNPVDLQKLKLVKTDASFVTGYAGSGTVQQTSDASQFPVGSSICFLLDPSKRGSYAQYCVVDRRAAARLPDNVSLKEAACVPLAGCTAYESLMKLGLCTEPTRTIINSLLIVGGSGGVGSWATRIARAFHPDLHIICTTSVSSDWCTMNGASRCIQHDAIEKELSGGPKGSVDAILCLAEPTPSTMNAISEVIRPYGSICLVVAGPSIQSLNLSFVFFKSVTVYTETVFNCFRTNFALHRPDIEMTHLLSCMSTEKIAAPLSPWLGDPDWTKATETNGILQQLETGHVQGKLVMQITDK